MLAVEGDEPEPTVALPGTNKSAPFSTTPGFPSGACVEPASASRRGDLSTRRCTLLRLQEFGARRFAVWSLIDTICGMLPARSPLHVFTNRTPSIIC
jgi:hypothetical protein